MILCQGQFERIVAHVAETTPSRLIKDIGARVMSHHFVSLGRDFLLHSLRAHLHIEVLLEAATHGLERADFL